MPGMKLLRKDRMHNNGGGIVIYFKPDLLNFDLAVSALDNNHEHNVEYICSRFQVGKIKSIIILCIYRPKFYLTVKDIYLFEKIVQELLTHNKNFYILGDLNIHFENNNNALIKKFNQMLKNNNIFRLISNGTRGVACLDTILSNNNTFCESGILSTFLSDHDACFVKHKLVNRNNLKKKILYRDYKNIDLVNFSQYLNVVTVDTSSVENMSLSFCKNIIDIFNSFAPVKKVKIKNRVNSFNLSDKSRSLRALLNSFHLDSSMSPILQKSNEYKETKRKLAYSIIYDKRKSINDRLKVGNKWKVLNTLLHKEDNNGICDIDVNILNNYYSGISNESHNLTLPDRPINMPRFERNFKPSAINAGELHLIFKSFKNKTGKAPDITGLTPLMLNMAADCPNVYEVILDIINASLTNAQFPNSLKMSCIKPIPKVKDAKTPDLFRPVTSQPLMGKILEKAYYNQVVRHINQNNIFYNAQFGFRQGHSTEHSMLALTDMIYKQIENNNICILIALDIRKSFDVIIREFIIEKFRWYNLDTSWLVDYFKGRCQFVQGADGKRSDIIFTNRGTAQGASMSSLIFSLYINDLPLILQKCVAFIFADDTNLCRFGRPCDIEILKNEIIDEFENINKWMTLNGLSLNIAKTQVMVLGSPHNVKEIGLIELNLGGVMIKSTNYIKVLGLKVDAALTWNLHINSISARAHNIIKSLYPLKNILNRNDLILMCNAYIISIINYMAIVYGTASKKNLTPIDRILRQAGRLILNKDWNESVKLDMITYVKWLFIDQIHARKVLTFTHSVLNNNCPPYFSKSISCNADLHSHNTRNKNMVAHTSIFNNKYSKRLIQNRAVVLWNGLPVESREMKSFNAFKAFLNEYLLMELINETLISRQQSYVKTCNLSCIMAAVNSSIIII